MKRKIGTFTVSLTLISLGVLLVISNFIDIDVLTSITTLFGVSLIFFGGEFIYYSSKKKDKDSDTNYRVSTGSVVTLFILGMFSVLFVAFGSFFSGFYNMAFTKTDDGDVVFTLGETTEHIVSKTYDGSFEEISILADDGNVVLYGEDRTDISVEMTIREWNKLKIDDAKLEELKNSDKNEYFNIDTSGNKKIIIRSINPTSTGGFASYDHSINFIIYVPKSMVFNIENGHGDTEVTGFQYGGIINNKHSDIHVKNITGPLEISNKHGRIDVDSLIGNANLKTTHDTIKVNNMTGDLTLDNEHGHIRASHINGVIDLLSESVSIHISDAPQPITVQGSHDSMNFINVKSLRLNGYHSDITVSNSEMELDLLQVTSDHGSVDLILPKTQQAKYNLTATHGNITSNLNTALEISSVDDNDDKNQNVNQTIGSDATTITVTTSHGDITLSQ